MYIYIYSIYHLLCKTQRIFLDISVSVHFVVSMTTYIVCPGTGILMSYDFH